MSVVGASRVPLDVRQGSFARRLERSLGVKVVRYSEARLARAVGIGRAVLREYQQKGLIRRPRRRGRAEYVEADVERVRLIALLAAAGFPLAQIAALLRRSDGDHAPGAIASECAGALDAMIGELGGRLDAIAGMRTVLLMARARLWRCSGCTLPRAACAGCAEQGALDPVSRVLLPRAG
jgi:DNA-binding transcriptional MerR regulator